MARRKTLIVLGAITFLVVIVATFPARVASQWFVPEQVRLGGVSGSIWSGQANEVAIGPEYFSNLSWDLKPLRLFTGSLALDAELTTLAGPVAMSVAVGLGGDLDNTVVLDADRVINPTGLRFADEFVRHKALDLIGDLALLGVELEGAVCVERGGHALHQRLVSAILTQPQASEWLGVTPQALHFETRLAAAAR